MSKLYTRGIVGFHRWNSSFTINSSYGTWYGNAPVTNMETDDLFTYGQALFSPTTDIDIVATSSTQRPVGLVGLVKHTGVADATWRVRLYEDTALATLLYDSGEMAMYDVVYDQQYLPAEHESWWSGKYTQEQLNARKYKTAMHWIGTHYLAKAVRVQVLNSTSAVFRASLLDISMGWEWPMNFDLGAEYGFKDRSDEVEAYSGHKSFGIKNNPKIFRGVVSQMPKNAARTLFLDMLEEHGKHTPFLWLPNVDDTIQMKQGGLVRWVDPGAFKYMSDDCDEVPVAFEEVK